jgi:hypothetical protein
MKRGKAHLLRELRLVLANRPLPNRHVAAQVACEKAHFETGFFT